jgi:hypothetical protein
MISQATRGPPNGRMSLQAINQRLTPNIMQLPFQRRPCGCVCGYGTPQFSILLPLAAGCMSAYKALSFQPTFHFPTTVPNPEAGRTIAKGSLRYCVEYTRPCCGDLIVFKNRLFQSLQPPSFNDWYQHVDPSILLLPRQTLLTASIVRTPAFSSTY